MSLLQIHESEMASELRALTRKFALAEMKPLTDVDEETETFRPELIQKLGALGLTGIPVAEEFGGAGLGYSDYIAAVEEIAAVNLGYAISIAVTGLPQTILSAFGNDEQKKKYIPVLASGQGIGAFSLSEASSGSNAGSLRTTAVKDGDHYVINGTKLWTTQADTAKIIMLMARTGGTGTKGISTFIIEGGTPGLSLGKREKKMGCSTSHTMELILENVRVPATQRVGREGAGYSVAMAALDSGRITIGACALGLARAALEIAVRHAHTREQFGKKIGEFQGVSFLLADMATQLQGARGLVQSAARLKDEGQPFSTEAAMAKLFATDMAMQVTTDAVQILGGSGYTREFPVERYMREAKMLQIVEGTNQIQRHIIGRDLIQRSEDRTEDRSETSTESSK